jgi:hypothetical protein
MKRKNVTRAALHRTALRSAKASAELERRGVPAGYVRSEKVNRFWLRAVISQPDGAA